MSVKTAAFDLAALKGTHDLKCLPSWGPYTKRYMGVSHIPSLPDGFRFDFAAAPGLHRRKIEIPNVMWDSGYYPLAASPDLRYYAHRHEISGDGMAYCDAEFFNLDDSSSAFRCRLVNKRKWKESLSLSLFAWMNFPQMRDYDITAVLPARPVLPASAVWTPAMRYSKISFAKPLLTESLSPDGRPHGQVRDHGFSGGEGCELGRYNGDKLYYTVNLQQAVQDAALLLRYRVKSGSSKISVSGALSGSFELCEGGFKTLSIKSGKTLSGAVELSFAKDSGSSVQLDGFAILPASELEAARFEDAPWNPVPEIARPSSSSMTLKYRDVACHYGLAWDSGKRSECVRQWHCKDLDCATRSQLNNLISTELKLGEGGHFASVIISPVFVDANSSVEVCGLLCCGGKEEVERRVKDFDASDSKLRARMDALAASAFKSGSSPKGARYAESQDFMAALTLSQVVYPVNTAGTMIRNSPPGRWWDCLYTWESGFMGLGLSALDPERAIWNLNAYMNQGESYAAFIHHGTPLPVQHYLFMEIWNRTRSVELLRHFHEPLKKFYMLLAGRLPGSTTRDLKSQLIRTWDYFYNSGGWDDYPPQVRIHDLKLEGSATPAVSTSHLIRVAKFMRTISLKLGLPTEIYDEDIAAFSEALLKHSWDAEAGYFSYVLHDSEGRPSGFLRHESGANYDMGMDGASPLVSGICDPAQEKALVANLMTKGRMWTDSGISTVDLRAPYYSDSGYWNGAVWLPHQWFFWKSMLDLGRADHAFKIASTALEVWRRETGRAHAAFEHFSVSSGRGAGWHHFSGLSCPVLNWFAAYYRPGNFNAGFDAFIESLDFSDGNKRLSVELSIHSSRKGHCSCVAVMEPNAKCRVLANGEPAKFKERLPGVLEIEIPLAGKPENVRLEVSAL